MNSRNLLIGIIALVIVGGGLIYLSSQANNPQLSITQPNATNEPIGGGPGDTQTQPSVKTFAVEGKPFEFNPKEIRVKLGDTVRIEFKNLEGFHDWAIDEFNVKTKQIQAGETDTVQFVADKLGTFEYYCSVTGHRQKGMVGNLIVE